MTVHIKGSLKTSYSQYPIQLYMSIENVKDRDESIAKNLTGLASTQLLKGNYS